MMRNLFKTWTMALNVIVLSLVMIGCASHDFPAFDDATTPQIKIGISWLEDPNQAEHGEDLQAYIDAVVASGAEPVLLPLIVNNAQAHQIVESLDGLILTGGEDIDPQLYGEAPIEQLEEIIPERDLSDLLLLEAALEQDLPMVAICRGMQVLNVYQGGSLYQDLPTQKPSHIEHRCPDLVDFTYHSIEIKPGSLLAEILAADKVEVNSWHHQGIKTVGTNLKVIATAEDGMIEALQKSDSRFVLGLQFHPEWQYVEGNQQMLAIFEELNRQALN